MSHVSMDSLGWVTKSPVLLSSLHRAQTYATQQQHRQMSLEHLLLALTEDSDALVVLHASKVDIERLRSAVSDLVGRNEDRAIIPDLAGPSASSDLITIFEYASAAADQSGRGQIDGAIVLAALIGEGNSSAARLLESHGLTFEHAIASLQNRVADAPAPAPAPAPVRQFQQHKSWHRRHPKALKCLHKHLHMCPHRLLKQPSKLSDVHRSLHRSLYRSLHRNAHNCKHKNNQW